MKRLLVDACAYAAFLGGQAWARDAMRHADELAVTPVVLGELRAGFLKGARRRKNDEELAEFLRSPRVSVVPLDEGTSLCYAAILDDLRRRGRPVPTNDLWIAASAMQHGMPVLTSDRHFLWIPQILVEGPPS